MFKRTLSLLTLMLPVASGPALAASDPGTATPALLLVVFGLILICVYLLPTVIAFRRAHASRVAILAFNLLLGWLFVPWVIALVWALSNPTVVVVHQVSQVSHNPGPPHT